MTRLWSVTVLSGGVTRNFCTEATTAATAKELVNLNFPCAKGAKIECREISRTLRKTQKTPGK